MIVLPLLLLAVLQAPNPCDTNDPGPFLVTSARAFTFQWCTAHTRVDSGITVPERIDGFYVVLDTGVKTDIGKGTFLGLSTATNRDAWQYIFGSGVQKGDHTVTVIAWNYVLDGFGVPTTQRVESAPAVIPFTAVDPISKSAPLAPTGLRLIR